MNRRRGGAQGSPAYRPPVARCGTTGRDADSPRPGRWHGSAVRHESGKTVKDAAAWLGMGESNVSKIEKAKQAIKVQTVRALCQFYDVDASKADYLIKLANESNQRGWWSQYRETVPDWFRQFIVLEADALDLWTYENEYVPGLLQTADYVRALMRSNQPTMTDEKVGQQVRLRRERQERLDGDYPPRLHFFINEAIIRRPVGPPEVMREQLAHLIESSKLDHVDLRIVPFSAGSHPGMSGPFVMFQFPEEDAPAFVYLEHERGAVYQEDPGDIDRYTVIVAELERLSLSPADSREMLSEAANQ
ncbi:helix-turn-helix domain-containing protein [Saccharopolyspora phatthalungensis]|uniref:DNA-binding Xre family transcriptional regulator n=1 Tax=Saccharopolyspora phatthalungensis TaxID=664693 RepID=A0A840QAA6_9PSEU|nr:helix-turn-helix transcriptional regulator [Saccharopolyspora phatthalungensis]MBB5159472.1 DNA-binding Xre family transcriptional regulator [Saccharopolyspora phatthalungensis]